jgi:diamine N-acetyltransferase
MISNDTVRLRAVELSDVDVMYQWENDTSLWYASSTITPFSRYQLEQFVRHSHLDVYETRQIRLMIESVATSEIVGMIDMFDYDPFHQRGAIGIMLHSRFRGRGLAVEALMLFTGYLFNYLGMHQAYASVAADNAESISLFGKCGFVMTGKRIQWSRRGSEYVDELFFQKIKG